MTPDVEALLLHLVTFRDTPPEVRAELLEALGELKIARDRNAELEAALREAADELQRFARAPGIPPVLATARAALAGHDGEEGRS